MDRPAYPLIRATGEALPGESGQPQDQPHRISPTGSAPPDQHRGQRQRLSTAGGETGEAGGGGVAVEEGSPCGMGDIKRPQWGRGGVRRREVVAAAAVEVGGDKMGNEKNRHVAEDEDEQKRAAARRSFGGKSDEWLPSVKVVKVVTEDAVSDATHPPHRLPHVKRRVCRGADVYVSKFLPPRCPG
ncbi:unnamed protein product [Merluccius merluccius]